MIGYNFWKAEHYDGPATKVQTLHDAGVRGANIVLGIQPHKHDTLHPFKMSPGMHQWHGEEGNRKTEALLNECDKRGWKITLKPHLHSLDRTDLGNLKWWSGFIDFDGRNREMFRNFMGALFDRVLADWAPDTICIENELMSMLHHEEMWESLIKRIGNRCETTCALNFFQAFKRHWTFRNSWINKYLVTEKNARKYINQFGYDPVVVDGVEWSRFKAELPSWLGLLDTIGINAYWFPTYTNAKWSQRQIEDVYRKFSVKPYWWLRISVNFPQLLHQTAQQFGKPVRITEIDAIKAPVMGNWGAYVTWWRATLNVMSQDLPTLTTLDVWDSHRWGWWPKMARQLLDSGYEPMQRLTGVK